MINFRLNARDSEINIWGHCEWLRKSEQIQRYEATSYEGAALERIEAIAKVLGIRETVKFELSMPLRVTKARA